VIELASGDHSVIVKKPGYKPSERKIKIGGDVRINAELEKNTDSPNAQ
jgi:PEGA domain